MKVLVIRFSSIGDIVLTTPVVRCLKTQLVNTQVHYVTKTAYSGILSENPYVDKVHVLKQSLRELARELKKEQFDFVIDLHKNLRSRFLCIRMGVQVFSFDKLNIQKWLLTTFKINKLPTLHIVDRYIMATNALGVKLDNLGLDYFIPEKDEISIDWLPKNYHRGYVAVVVGAKFATKQLPVNRMIELCDRINKPIVLLGGAEDESYAQRIVEFFQQDAGKEYESGLAELGKKTQIFNAVGKCNLNQSASLLKQSNWVFTHDTGLMHIAAAFKKLIFCIWGNTVPEFGMYPFRTKFVIFENKKIQCRPCSKIGYNKCPKGHFKCMNNLVFDFYLG